MDFMGNVKETLNEDFNYSVTENGALGYATTGKNLLDINFAVSSLRNMNSQDIIDKYMKAYFEDKVLAIKWLFFLRDCRGGLGEKKSFRVIFNYMLKTYPGEFMQLISLIPEYGYYKDLWQDVELDSNEFKVMALYITGKFLEDITKQQCGEPISLLAKWMPSCNTSSYVTRKYAKALRQEMGLSEKEYRKSLSLLREYLRVTEVYMSSKHWSDIKYEAVPSKANLVYGNAFLRHDTERRTEYLQKLSKGETKINAGVLMPHEIVHKYSVIGYNRYNNMHLNSTLEELWKALPNTIKGESNTLVVCDSSGSMLCYIDNKSDTMAIEVSNALAIYFAEKSKGSFKDKFITFGSKPQLVDLSNCKTLYDKLMYSKRFNDCSNTNIEATFDLILKTAINGNMKQEDMPKNILIVSDMEFDYATGDDYYGGKSKLTERLFTTISKKFTDHGYKMPRLIFWNVNSRTGTIPVKENELGVALVSGFSTSIMQMVLSDELDPYKCLVNVLNSERYDLVESALESA